MMKAMPANLRQQMIDKLPDGEVALTLVGYTSDMHLPALVPCAALPRPRLSALPVTTKPMPPAPTKPAPPLPPAIVELMPQKSDEVWERISDDDDDDQQRSSLKRKEPSSSPDVAEDEPMPSSSGAAAAAPAVVPQVAQPSAPASSLGSHHSDAGPSSSQLAVVVRQARPPVLPPLDQVPEKLFKWVTDNVPGVSMNDVGRIARAFCYADFDPDIHVDSDSVVPFELHNDRMWVRIALNGFMTGEDVDFDPETGEGWQSEFKGIHCTNTGAALGILCDRSIKEGGFGPNSYCRLSQNPGDMKSVVDDIIAAGAEATKNSSDVMFEVRAKGPHRPTIKWAKDNDREERGTAADMVLCSMGFIAHYNDKKKDNRWLVPLRMLSIRALWLTAESFCDLERSVVAMRMRP